MYQINAISKKFKLEKLEITVFQDISFKIEKGEWIALTGASGCGKTTLLHLLGGLDKPSSGEIIFNNNNLAKMTARNRSFFRRNKIGFIFQTYNLFPELNALENVLLPVRIIGKKTTEMEQKALELLSEVGLSHRATHRPAELSGGEQQRVAIARALIMNPEILLADEPTGNLDDENSAEIMKIFQKLHSERGITILMVTHQKELTHFATRTLHLEKGHII